jgi:hypothetical protein
MEKNLKNELQEMKFLFGYKPGRVISEQHIPMDEDEFDMDIDFADTDVAPAPTREKERTKERETEKEKPYDPARRERDPSRLPYTDPDTHPQGEVEYELELDSLPSFGDDDDDYEVDYEMELDGDDEDVNESFVDDVDSEYENSDLADLVKKYLGKRS